ncbi:MAG: CdaR family protein [Lachnospiraceae bacterium]|nr:CdaR family protein [Lachnospiraceae bacterium]
MKNKLTDNLILKVLSVFLAILIWIMVVNIQDPSKTRVISGIKVTVENESVITGNNQVYTITEGQIISVKVTGPRTIVDSLKASDFVATADFKDISQANSVPINVELKEYANQQKVTINEISNNTLRLEIEDIVDKNYDVQVKYLGTMPGSYVVAETSLDVESVKVTAPQSVQDSIKEVCVSVNVDNATADFETTSAVKVYSSTGVELLQSNENVSVDVENIQTYNTVYYTKKIALNYQNIESSLNNIKVTEVQLSANTLSVMGRKEVLDQLTEITLPTQDIVIAETTTEKIEKEYNVEELLPKGVYLYDQSAKVVLTVRLEETVKKIFTIAAEDIAIKNIPDGMDASIGSTGNLTITIEGMNQAISEFDADDVIAYVSLRNLKEGSSRVAIELQLPEGVTQVGTVYVDVSLTKTTDNQTSQNPESHSSQQGTTATPDENTMPEENTSGREETTTATEDDINQSET